MQNQPIYFSSVDIHDRIEKSHARIRSDRALGERFNGRARQLTVTAWTWRVNPARLKRRAIFEERLKEPTVICTMSARVEYDLHVCLLFADLLWRCCISGFGDILTDFMAGVSDVVAPRNWASVVLPKVSPFKAIFSAFWSHRRAGYVWQIHQRCRDFVPDCAVRSFFVVVSTTARQAMLASLRGAICTDKCEGRTGSANMPSGSISAKQFLSRQPAFFFEQPLYAPCGICRSTGLRAFAS